MYVKLLDDKCSRRKAKKSMRESEGPFLLVNLKESFLDFLKLGVKKLIIASSGGKCSLFNQCSIQILCLTYILLSKS